MRRKTRVKFSFLIFVFLVLFGLLIGIVYATESHTIATVQVLGKEFITIYSPIETIYNTRLILLNVSLAETAKSLYYKINAGKWTKLCFNCNKYSRLFNFAEGVNNLTLNATTYDNRNYLKSVLFVVDTTKPRILDTYPRFYGKGLFGVWYTELNLQNVTLFYGTNYFNLNKSKQFNCISGTYVWCMDYADVSEYEGQYIYYQFLLKDKFYSTYSSRNRIRIDTINPVLNVYSPKNISYVNSKGWVYINISSNERVDMDYSDNNGSWVKLCYYCTSWNGYKGFSFGSHNVIFRAKDYARNKDEEQVSFNISRY